ncbi:MAG TPA: MFS transporter [Dehalococcoidia bacterium]|jgi:MFS family permease|nr:MFS transporter [Dehalococcoidia bacterium]
MLNRISNRVFRQTFDIFDIGSFRRLWSSAVLFSMGQWLDRTIVGWLVLDMTGSAFLTGLVWAVRFCPNLLFGPVMGVISDRYPRGRTLSINAGVRAIAMLLTGLLFFLGQESLLVLLILALIGGTSTTLQMAVLQPLAAEVVGDSRLSNGVTITSLGQRAVGAVGALLGGILLATTSPAWIFVFAALPLVVSAGVFLTISPNFSREMKVSSFLSDMLEGLDVIRGRRAVLVLLVLMAFTEMFGFSFNGFLPVVAEDLLRIGPEGLGLLTSATAVGGFLGVLGLTLHHGAIRRGLLLLGIIASFGVLEILLGISNNLGVSWMLLACLGAMGALVDSLQWILLQTAVPSDMRGRVMGWWNVAIGCGWIGTIGLGIIADTHGIQASLSIAGVILLLVAFSALTISSQVRRI